jgi:MFS family permease
VVLILLALGSFGRGFSSVAFKDVTGKTIPEGNRGTLLALRATLGGILALAAGFVIRSQFSNQDTDSITPYLILIGLAGFLWIASMIPVSALREHPGATDGGRNFVEELRKGYQVLRQEPGFRRFVINRAVLLSIELSLPFFALYARQETGGSFSALGSFVIAGSISRIFSSPLWGRFADRSSRIVMLLSAAMAGMAGFSILAIDTFEFIPINNYLLAIPLIIIGFAIAGARLGRKTYLIDSAPEDQRPLYAAVSNTISGVLILAGGSLGLIAENYGVVVLILVLTLLYLLGIVTSYRLPEAEHLT